MKADPSADKEIGVLVVHPPSAFPIGSSRFSRFDKQLRRLVE